MNNRIDLLRTPRQRRHADAQRRSAARAMAGVLDQWLAYAARDLPADALADLIAATLSVRADYSAAAAREIGDGGA